MNCKPVLFVAIALLVGISVGWSICNHTFESSVVIHNETKEVFPLLKYSIENLADRAFGSEIILDEILATESSYIRQRFHFLSDGKNVSGLAHIPSGCSAANRCSVIVQLRGYAEREKYSPGFGTRRSAEEYSKSGFISLAPDFLGYGSSASPSADVFQARFETYTTVLNLLDGVKNWNYGNGKMGIWGHSNGGHIALTVLEITKGNYPTVLWAPVSAGFPYSILFYMDNNETGDRELRAKLADFEKMYDAGKFNLLNFLNEIDAPILLHQGTDDNSIPITWSRNLVALLKRMNKRIEYNEYVGADHNLNPKWDEVVKRDVIFFDKNLRVD